MTDNAFTEAVAHTGSSKAAFAAMRADVDRLSRIFAASFTTPAMLAQAPDLIDAVIQNAQRLKRAVQ